MYQITKGTNQEPMQTSTNTQMNKCMMITKVSGSRITGMNNDKACLTETSPTGMNSIGQKHMIITQEDKTITGTLGIIEINSSTIITIIMKNGVLTAIHQCDENRHTQEIT